jgi:hypothetical protein
MREAAADCDGETRGCDSLAGEFASSDVRQLGAMVDRTPRRGLGEPAMPLETAPNLAGQPIPCTGAHEQVRNPGCAPA